MSRTVREDTKPDKYKHFTCRVLTPNTGLGGATITWLLTRNRSEVDNADRMVVIYKLPTIINERVGGWLQIVQ